MNECIHGLESDRCETCNSRVPQGHNPNDDWAGKSFALVFAPSLRDDTFLHLNREGDHWKLRWYPSPNRPAVELAQSGKSSTRLLVDLGELQRDVEIPYPYSTSPGGVSIKDSRYWFDEIAKLNTEHGISSAEPLT